MKITSARISVSIIIVYILTSPLYLYLNISYGDIWLLLCLSAVFLDKNIASSLAHFYRSVYGTLLLLLMCALLLTTFASASVVNNLKYILQFAFIFGVLIPVVAVGFANMEAPLVILEVSIWISFLFYIGGLILLFHFNTDWIIYQTGANRYFLRFDLSPFLLSSYSLFLTGLFFIRRHNFRYIILGLLGLVPIIFSASRAVLLSYITTVIAAAFLRFRSVKSNVLVLMAAIIGYYFFTSDILRTSFDIINRNREFFSDIARGSLNRWSIEVISRDLKVLLFGVGWGTESNVFGGTSQAVHNLPLQVITDSGIFCGLILLTLLGIPIIWLLVSYRANEPDRFFSALIAVTLYTIWMFHPISTERAGWLLFAILVGLAYRLRVEHKLEKS